MAKPNRYAEDWNSYSETWDQNYGQKHKHLGDEWIAHDVRGGRGDDFILNMFGLPFLEPEDTVLEVGPGGGKWTIQIAKKVKKVIALDVSPAMLARTQKRCEAEGLNNVDCVLGNGADFKPITDDSVDFFFSYDVFVHLPIEDTLAYVREMARVMKVRAFGTCHHAINTPPDALDRIDQNAEWYRDGTHTLGQYFYHSPESLRRLYERFGLPIDVTHEWWCMWMCVFKKPAPFVPRLEDLLHRLAGKDADDEKVRAQIIDELKSLPSLLQKTIEPMLEKLASQSQQDDRASGSTLLRKQIRGF